jgi:hypothetical protein
MDLGGLNPHHAVAGLGGGVAALPFTKPVSRLMAVGFIVAGLMTAIYLTPLAAEGLLVSGLLKSALSARAELGLAFLLGVTAMVLIPTIIGMATWCRDNVGAIMKRVTGGKTEGQP